MNSSRLPANRVIHLLEPNEFEPLNRGNTDHAHSKPSNDRPRASFDAARPRAQLGGGAGGVVAASPGADARGVAEVTVHDAGSTVSGGAVAAVLLRIACIGTRSICGDPIGECRPATVTESEPLPSVAADDLADAIKVQRLQSPGGGG